MTPEQREKARLRSERWRRAHGIMPRKPAQRPWLAEGISRSTWYRRKKAKETLEFQAVKTLEVSSTLSPRQNPSRLRSRATLQGALRLMPSWSGSLPPPMRLLPACVRAKL